MSDPLRIVIILLLVLGNAVFVAAEYSLVTSRRTRLEELAKRGNRRANTALRLLDEPVRFISTVQVGITVFGILLGALGEPFISSFFDDWVSRGVAFIFSFLILTYLSVVLGELGSGEKLLLEPLHTRSSGSCRGRRTPSPASSAFSRPRPG